MYDRVSEAAAMVENLTLGNNAQEDKKGQSSPLSRFEVYGALLEQPPHNSKQPIIKNLVYSKLISNV